MPFGRDGVPSSGILKELTSAELKAVVDRLLQSNNLSITKLEEIGRECARRKRDGRSDAIIEELMGRVAELLGRPKEETPNDDSGGTPDES